MDLEPPEVLDRNPPLVGGSRPRGVVGVPQEQPPQQDVLILSTSLHKTAMTTYDNVLSCYSHLDN